ncbi:MAG: 1-acyl-sn-glycerol-3-phosphate acyltransferase [Betaproteobacteria bacterium]|nr:1-acyl-sn-glycerol-3-phosphate acyltransferase [Betaproteobacteria bacterium]
MILRSLRALWAYTALWYGLALLGLGSLTWSLVAAPLRLLLPDRIGRALGRRVVARGFRFYLGALEMVGACRFDLAALDALRAAGPLILAPNHPTLLDAVMLLSRLPQAACVLKAPLANGMVFGAGARLAGYIRNDWPVGMVRLSVEELRRGGQLLLFPEGTRTTRSPVNAFRGAIALIARQAGVPVQTVFIEADSSFLGKGWPLTRRPRLPLNYRVRLGRRFDPPRDLRAFVRELEQYYAAELAQPLGPSLQFPAGVESRPA